MNKKIENVATVESHTLINRKEKNKINERDICINASNFGVQLKKEKDNNSGRRPRRPVKKEKTYK